MDKDLGEILDHVLFMSTALLIRAFVTAVTAADDHFSGLMRQGPWHGYKNNECS